MTFQDVGFLWAISAKVCGPKSLTATKRRVEFMIQALLNYKLLKPLIDAPGTTALGRFVSHRPECVGALLWPYQCSDWKPDVRLARIFAHYSAISQVYSPFDFSPDDQLPMLDLQEILPGLHLIIEQPHWFMREGQITMSLFHGETRIYSLIFSLRNEGDILAAFIGGIQGRDIEGALDLYRDITKASYGLRPRDLLIELFRIVCEQLGVTEIFAVADEYRQNRSSYFGRSAKTKALPTNYNEIWEDRGGSRVDPTFYRLPLQSSRRNLEEIPAKKRGMYRRRYELLNALTAQLQMNYRRMSPEPATIVPQVHSSARN